MQVEYLTSKYFLRMVILLEPQIGVNKENRVIKRISLSWDDGNRPCGFFGWHFGFFGMIQSLWLVYSKFIFNKFMQNLKSLGGLFPRFSQQYMDLLTHD